MAVHINMFDNPKLTHPDGRMHHLGINETEITERCLLSSNLERVTTIAGSFDRAEKTGEFREYITYKGEKNGVPLSVMSVGMGCMPTAIAVEELRHAGSRILLKVGTCSAIQKNIKPGTLIVPRAAVRGEGATVEYINLQYPAIADPDLLLAVTEACGESSESWRMGIVRTHDAIFLESRFGHPGVLKRLEPWINLGVCAVENEIAALYTVASLVRSRAAALLLAVDNLVTGETIDFESGYDRLMDKVISIAVRAITKFES
jgi:uridine phosphorylase